MYITVESKVKQQHGRQQQHFALCADRLEEVEAVFVVDGAETFLQPRHHRDLHPGHWVDDVILGVLGVTPVELVDSGNGRKSVSLVHKTEERPV